MDMRVKLCVCVVSFSTVPGPLLLQLMWVLLFHHQGCRGGVEEERAEELLHLLSSRGQLGTVRTPYDGCLLAVSS